MEAIAKLDAAGKMIAGHTINHLGLKAPKTHEARVQVCKDRNTLLKHGFEPTSFAYPFGSFDAGTEKVVKACGYNSGRGVSGIRYKGKHAVYDRDDPAGRSLFDSDAAEPEAGHDPGHDQELCDGG